MKVLPVLNLPALPKAHPINHDRGQIYDLVSRKNIRLSPEEWVRQHVLFYLLSNYPIPSTHIQNEHFLNKGFKGKKGRIDVLVWDKSGNPWLTVECKAPHIKIDDHVAQQAWAYHINNPSKYLWITNGIDHRSWLFDNEHASFQLTGINFVYL